MKHLKNILLFSTILFLFACSNGSEPLPSKPEVIELEGRKIDPNSYVLGLSMGKMLSMSGRSEFTDDQLYSYILGIKDFLSKKNKFKYTDAEIRKTIKDQHAQVNKVQITKNELYIVKNKKRIDAFLVDIKNEKDIIKLDAGGTYRVLKHGKGKTPNVTDIVHLHLRSSLASTGQVFYSNFYDEQPDVTDTPISYLISRIPLTGLKEAVQHMKVGDKWLLHLKAKQAYGNSAVRGVPANSDVILEVELLKIETVDSAVIAKKSPGNTKKSTLKK